MLSAAVKPSQPGRHGGPGERKEAKSPVTRAAGPAEGSPRWPHSEVWEGGVQ